MTTDQFMQEVWRGPDEEKAMCRRYLDALGDGPEADRLRDLLARIVRYYRRQSGPAWPAWPYIVTAEGDRVTPQKVAVAIGWPLDRINADIDRLVQVGLLRYDEPET